VRIRFGHLIRATERRLGAYQPIESAKWMIFSRFHGLGLGDRRHRLELGASRLNSGVNARLVLPMLSTSWVSMPHPFRGVHYFGGGSAAGVTALSFRQETVQLVHRRFKLRGIKSPPTLNLIIENVDRIFYRF
jgi:hypothetical protein